MVVNYYLFSLRIIDTGTNVAFIRIIAEMGGNVMMNCRYALDLPA